MLSTFLQSVDADQDKQGDQTQAYEPEDGPFGGVAFPALALGAAAAAATAGNEAATALLGVRGLFLLDLLPLQLQL